ncbi:isoquinoline 1-oxidoreductase, beta subunit [Rhizobiales bacterium GAS188]|nr:isoquinoline 1-oxidoreductase, beta subunit [Rhizobiales bacterium GAS188]
MLTSAPRRHASSVPSRRTFLKGAAGAAGVFILGSYVPFPGRALAQSGPAKGPFDPNLFLKIGADDTVTLISKHLEMGQGVITGMATLVAEELDADWSKMSFEFAPNDAKIYNNLLFGPVMATGGTTSTAESFGQMRQVGAAARAMFVAAAAAKWAVPLAEIKVETGIVSHAGSGKRASFGELAADAMRVPVPSDVKLKDAKDWKLIGTHVPRLDSPAKTTGTAIFALDIRRPGMLTALVKRPDQFGATVASFDATAAKAVPGVVDVVQIPSGVAVLASDTWAAMRGRDALKVSWDTSKAETRSTLEILAEYREALAAPGLVALDRGNAASALAGAARTIAVEFTFPYLAHAPMEPLNCVLEARPDGADLWSGSQLQSIDEYAVWQVLGLRPEQVKIHTLLAGGSFGRRGNPVADWTFEIASIVKAIQGRAPVHLVWTREDDIKGGFYRPMVVHRVKAGLDAQGQISGWQHQVASKSIFTGTPFEQMAVKDGLDASSVEGIADTSYAIGDFKVEAHNVTSPVPVLWWRSVGHSHTGHVMETVVDELAFLAGKDPIAFRLELLKQQPRDAAVLKLAADKAGWGTPLPKGQGRGVAYHLSFGTRVAMIAEVSVAASGLKVDRIVAAVDCGIAVDPDVVKAQVEGAVGFALSAALRNQVTLRKGVVEQSNFDDYEPTRIREMPKVEVHIVPSAEWPSGIGEPGVAPLAPAIGNAIFAATGKRLRSLPLEIGGLA